MSLGSQTEQQPGSALLAVVLTALVPSAVLAVRERGGRRAHAVAPPA